MARRGKGAGFGLTMGRKQYHHWAESAPAQHNMICKIGFTTKKIGVLEENDRPICGSNHVNSTFKESEILEAIFREPPKHLRFCTSKMVSNPRFGIPIIFPRPTAYAQFQWCSLTLLLVRIDTGRRHQIRSHFAFLQHATVSHWGLWRASANHWGMVNHSIP